MRIFSRQIASLALTIAISGISMFCSSQEREIQRMQLLMGTKVEIIAQGKKEDILEDAVDKAFKDIERLERKLSRYNPDSMISRINQSAGESPVRVDDETFMLIQKSVEVCAQSNGAFDITILPVLMLWKIDNDNPVPPDDADVKEKLKQTGCQKIVLDEKTHTVFLPEKGMGIDLGGIAKGYAVDSAVRVLKNNAVRSGLVNAGGDIVVFGARGKGMAIGIQHPREREKIIAKIYLSDGAIATSGDYERFYIYNGVRYSHIINPKTGYPVQGEASVSVKADSCLVADAWSTALFVMGREAGMKILQSHPGIEALFIGPSGSMSATSWFWGQVSTYNISGISGRD